MNVPPIRISTGKHVVDEMSAGLRRLDTTKHTPIRVPHLDEDIAGVNHVFDGRSGGLGLLMQVLDQKLGLFLEAAPEGLVSSRLDELVQSLQIVQIHFSCYF